MQILEDNRRETGWVTLVIDGRWVQAKVYDEPSMFGVNEGRVSKISIGKTSGWNPNLNFFRQMDYNYDRGLDFDNLPSGVLDTIISQLETLPQVFTYG